MATIYSGVMRTQFTTASTYPLAELRAAATSNVRLLEVGIVLTNVTATNMSIGFGRSTSIGTLVPGGWASLLTEDDPTASSVPAPAVMAWDWSLPPGTPAAYLRRFANNSTSGVPFGFIFPRGILIPAGGSVGLWRVSGAQPSGFDVHWVVDA